MSEDCAIEVADLAKTYRSGLFGRREVEALRGVSFRVGKGEIFGLLGPNGAGKTTLVKVLLGIVHKTGGDARLLGQDAGATAARRRVGYLPEHHRIPLHHTGNTALEYYGSLSDMPGAEIRAKRPDLLKTVGLEKWGDHPVRGYSKGMLQRLGLAQAILHDPDLIILDEPTDGVDPVGRAEMREVLKGLRDRGHTIFLNSHLLQEIELICERVVILDRGQVRCESSVDELTKRSGTDVTMSLTGDLETVRGLFAKETVTALREMAPRRLVLTLRLADQAAVDAAVDGLRGAGVSIASLAKEKRTLEEAFLDIVKQPEHA